MIEELLKEQIRQDEEIKEMMAQYRGVPAIFHKKSPPDIESGWISSCYPRGDFTIDMRYDPERKTQGTLAIEIFCLRENSVTPEDVERRLVELINGAFYTADSAAVCAVWNRSDTFDFEQPAVLNNNTSPEGFGVTILFDLLSFPILETTDPDPALGLNNWTKANYPEAVVIGCDEMKGIYNPTDDNPVVYWRFESAEADCKQTYAVNWYTGRFAAHVTAGGIAGRNRFIKDIAERLLLEGEVLLVDGSPMFVKHISIRYGAEPLREGQLMLTGLYGVLTSPRKEKPQEPLNNAGFANIESDGKNKPCFEFTVSKH